MEPSDVAVPSSTDSLRVTRIDFMGLPLDALTMHDTVRECVALAADGASHQHVVLNASKVNLCARDQALAAIVRGADIVSADGQSVVWASGFLGRPLPERVAGIDLMHALLAEAACSDLPTFFLGARQEVLDLAVERFAEQYPGLNVAGSHDGYFDDAEHVCSLIADSGARLLFVGMPSPRKEHFVAACLPSMGPVLAVGVGGSFDVVAGRVSRAPKWMQRTGLEWLYRFWQEPGRMWRRYLIGNPEFVARVLRAKLRA